MVSDALIDRNSLNLLSWYGSLGFDAVDFGFFPSLFMQVNDFGKNVWQFLIHKIVLVHAS